MQFITAIVNSPVKVTVGVLLVALFGGVALTAMPMQLTPEVQIPTLTIETRWPGASPQEIEQEIILEQEEFLKSVEGVSKMTSESSDSVGRIVLEFLIGTNMDEALLKVNSRLQQVPEYPEDADQPVISTSNAADRPIAWFILSPRPASSDELNQFAEQHPKLQSQIARVQRADNPALQLLYLRELAAEHPEAETLLPPDDLDVTKMKRFAEDVIEARFERVPGVSNANVIGGLEDELQVVVDPNRLAARQVTISDVERVLRGQNNDVSAGDFWEGKRRWVVRTLGQFRDPTDVEMQLLAVRDGSPVYVRDVAEVRMGYKKPDGLVRRFGGSCIAVNALRETGANVLDVMAGLGEATDELNETWLKRQGLQLKQVYDETDYIYSAVGLVRDNLIVGGALTMIVLMLFLHLGVRTLLVIPLIAITAVSAVYISPWFFAVCLALIIGAGFWFARGALVVGLAIPTSIIGTFLVLGMMGRSLNVISLAGLAFAVGMLVDNAVVVLENIYSHYSRGTKPFVAAARATQEVWGAVLASTLTTVAVFIPVVFVQEEAGQLFRDIALAISAAVGLSLIVSMTLIPMASARLFGKRGESIPGTSVAHDGTAHAGNGAARKHVATSRTNRIAHAIVAPINWLGAAFIATVVAVNRWTLKGVVRRLAVAVGMVGIAVALMYLFWPKVEYLPNGNRNLVIALLLPPPGYNIDELTAMGTTVEEELRPYWDIDPTSAEAAKLDYPAIDDFFFVARGRQVFLGLRAYDGARVAELIPLIRQIGSKLPGTITVAFQTSLFEQGLTAGRSIDVEITGPDLQQLVAMGGEIFGKFVGPPDKQLIPGAQARPIPSLDLSSPEMHVTPKLVQSAEMGVNTSTLGYWVNALVDGAYSGDYIVGGEKIDLTIIGSEQSIRNTQDLKALPVAVPERPQPVPLEALADVTLSSGPEQINHRERVRAITIAVTPPETVPLEDAMERIQTEIVAPMRDSGRLDGGYMINLAGTADKLRDTWEALRFNVLLALLITYLLMAALFESWLYPFVIILTVPLGAVGGILGLNLLSFGLQMAGYPPQSLDVLTMLGFVILIGTVVNNPILIVHQSLNHMREDGMDQGAAILESVRTRIRPIFMTTITTVLGLMPLVLFPGAGSELYRGLGSVVLGGLLVSTVFTLLLVPTVFSLTMDAKLAVVRLLGYESREMAAVAATAGPGSVTAPAQHDVYAFDEDQPYAPDDDSAIEPAEAPAAHGPAAKH